MLTEAIPAVPALQRHILNGPTMGTRYGVVFYVVDRPSLSGLGAALQAAVDEVDGQMSTWTPKSDLMRFNAAPVGSWITLPAELRTVIATGLDIGRASGGAFDIATGDLVAAWGFDRKNGVPDPTAVARLAATPRYAAYGRLEHDPAGGRMRKLATLSINLSGIAKGYGVDRLAEVLDDFGISDYLVSIDGEVRAAGSKPGGEPWRVAIEAPQRGTRDIAGYIELTDGALATSGDYRHFVEHDGRTYSHTMDPRTGRPLQNGIKSVTVRARTCMLADAWATAMLVLGPDIGLPLAAGNGVEAMFAVA